jgi:putative transposase
MADTFTQIHFHVVFATKFRDRFIHPSWQERLHRYITGIVQKYGHKMIQINSMPDHVHMLIGMRPNQSLSDLMKIIKSETSKWIKNEGYANGFSWQAGFGAFSYSKILLPKVISYIQNQEEHHRKKSFREEYIQ